MQKPLKPNKVKAWDIGPGNYCCIIKITTNMNKNSTKKGLILCGPQASGKTTMLKHIIGQHKKGEYVLVQNYHSLQVLPFELLAKPRRLIIFEGVHFDYGVILSIYQSIVSSMDTLRRPMPSIIFTFTSIKGEVYRNMIDQEQFDLIELNHLPFQKLEQNPVYHIE